MPDPWSVPRLEARALMAALPTIQIVHPKRPEEFAIINASDFDPARHVRWEDRGRPAPLESGAMPSAADESMPARRRMKVVR